MTEQIDIDTDIVREFYAHDVLAVDPGDLEDLLYAFCDEIDRLRGLVNELAMLYEDNTGAPPHTSIGPVEADRG